MIEIGWEDRQDLGVTEFVVTVDPDVGLEPNDIGVAVGALTPDLVPRNIVRVVIYKPSTTDATLLDQLRQEIAQRLQALGKTPAWA
jgi:hypothetical protein